MNKIKEVKNKADIIKIANFYNLNLNRSNKTLCPFHSENTPSFSISESKQIWKCFGCNKGGDVIKLVQELENINAYEAAKKINDILDIGIDFGKKTSKVEINRYKAKQDIIDRFRKWEYEAGAILCDYLNLLNKWREFADFGNNLFVESLQNMYYIEYLIDEYFVNGTEFDRVELWENKNMYINNLKSKINTIKRRI